MPRPPDPTAFLPLKTDVTFILLALAGPPRHGYAILQDVADRSGDEVRLQTGALYRTLRQLLRDGLIEECDRPAGEASTDERRRYYRATRLGRAVLDADVTRMSRVVRAARGRRPRLA
jgi:DNA-binding PadR family transcriptional regulator